MQSRRYLTIILIVGFFTHFAYAQYTIEGLTSCTGGGFAQDAANTAFSTMGQASPPDTAVSGDYFLYSGSIYVFDIEEIQAFVAAPVFSPESGDYRDSVKVWITCSTEGAEIYYTKNGHDPTNADLLYSDTLIIDTTTTLKARAFKDGSDPSSIAVANFTIVKKVSTPVLFPAAGDYQDSVRIFISCETAGASIYHTINGGEPDQSSFLFTDSISITETSIVQAMAFLDGFEASETATATYNIILPGQIATPTFDPEPGEYQDSVLVRFECATDSVTMYYTDDGSDPTTASPEYGNTPIILKLTATFKVIAYREGYIPSNIASGTYTITQPEIVSVPEFNPTAGEYVDSVKVAITCATESASIYYTTTGDDPTEKSHLYQNTILVKELTTFKARAFKQGASPSEIVAATYNIVNSQAPRITLNTISEAIYGQAKSIDATITHPVGVENVMLLFRKGGGSLFDSTAMSNSSEDTYTGTTPAASVTEWGIEIQVRAADSQGNIAVQPSIPQPIIVTFETLDCPIAFPDTSYRMISVPVSLNSNDIASVLSDDLGSHDRTQWRLLRKKSGGFAEYGVDNNFDGFDPGNGFWIILKTAKSWDVGAGTSVSIGSPVSVILDPGWNQIGNPFAFPVSWSNVSANGDVEAPVGYEGLGNAISGYQYQQTELTPWKGYYVKNLTSQEVTLEIAPKALESSSAKRTLPSISSSLEAEEWMLCLHAESDKLVDPDNWIGFRKNASNIWDLNDFSEVPPFGTFLSLYFNHEDWEKYPGLYTGDFRMDDFIWSFTVRSSLAHREIRLSLGEIFQLPEEFDARLVDQQTGTITDLLEKKKYVFISGKMESHRKFLLFVGSNLNDQDLLQVVEILPISFKLYPNFPNPFNPETRILYDVPEQSQVSIEVYDLIGKRIRTLVHGIRPQGRHTVTWFGRDQYGVNVATGVYLLRMQAGSFTAVQKMVFVK